VNIRTRFTLTIWASVVILAAGSAGMVAGIWQTRASIEETLLIDGLVRDLYILRGLSLEYEQNPSRRAEDQWRKQYGLTLRRTVDVTRLPPEVNEAYTNVRSIFGRIVRPEAPASAGQEARRLDERLAKQLLSSLLTETQRIIDWAQDLSDESRARQMTLIKAYSTGALVLLSCIALLTAWILMTSERRIVRSISTLKEGAEAVARGDLERRITISSEDEFGELASTFNTMAVKLQAEAELEAHLAQAQKLEAIGTLAGGIAHDFNNILSGIIGYTELALTRTRDAKVVEWLNESLHASRRAGDLVRQILTFSRNPMQERRPVEVGLLVKEALKLMRASTPVTVEIRQAIFSTAAVMADPTEIHRLVVNLCTNAVLAMRDRGGVLEVGLDEVLLDAGFILARPGVEAGRFLRLIVRDTGTGMTPEVKSRAFDPFFTTRKEQGGTGMGLSVVHGIVQKLNGTISVETEPGRGSTFSVFLPVLASREEAPGPGEETPLPGTERILLVDDEALVAGFSREMLSGLGYTVEAFTSGVEALEAFRSRPSGYDLVITDMTMPVMTGDILAGRLREIRPDIPIILCTGFSEQVSAERARGLGIDEFVLKPLVMAGLSRVIRRVLDRPR
jgi:signal transduction histidine kinase